MELLEVLPSAEGSDLVLHIHRSLVKLLELLEKDKKVLLEQLLSLLSREQHSVQLETRCWSRHTRCTGLANTS